MSEKYDLHSHSTASDGALTPSELIFRAARQGVTALALTDHDTGAGLTEARQAAIAAGIQLIPGIELSATWKNKTLHIVGLNIDPSNQALSAGIKELQILRRQRAEKIALKLEKKNIPGAWEAVRESTGNGMITRSHFAQFLLTQRYVSNLQEAFDRYLGHGKPAFVATSWTELEKALAWITASGGIAVLAHPLRYKLSASWMRRLLAAFKEMGGQGMEVVCGHNNAQEIHISANYAQSFDLYGSTGSDFHSPSNPWVELGRLSPLPENIKPVWELLE